MIRALRKIDRLYFGQRVGAGSAAHALGWLLTGQMPWSFVGRYLRGDFVND